MARLLDRDSPFLELSPLAGLGLHDDDGKSLVLGGGSIVGIGIVAGKRVLVSASDSGIKGGTVPPMGLKKALRAQELARENKLPLVSLVESGGANLIYQAEIFIDGGRSFANQARLSAAGIPQIAVVHGASTAGGAYLPGLSDYVVLVRGRSSIYSGRPAAGQGRDRRGRRSKRRWAAPRCTPASPAWASTWPRTTPTPSPWPASCSTSCPGTACRRRPAFDAPRLRDRRTAGPGARRRTRTL